VVDEERMRCHSLVKVSILSLLQWFCCLSDRNGIQKSGKRKLTGKKLANRSSPGKRPLKQTWRYRYRYLLTFLQLKSQITTKSKEKVLKKQTTQTINLRHEKRG